MNSNEMKMFGTKPMGAQELRIERLKQQLDSLAGGAVKVACSSSCDLNSFERFLQQVVAYKLRERQEELRRPARSGPNLPGPGTLDDLALTDRLWEEIRRLARQEIYLDHTDHLTDRELYKFLWERARGEESTAPSAPPNHCLDLVGGTSDQETYIYLKHYADDSERQRWLEDVPDYDLPEHEDPPYDRDRHLPRPDW